MGDEVYAASAVGIYAFAGAGCWVLESSELTVSTQFSSPTHVQAAQYYHRVARANRVDVQHRLPKSVTKGVQLFS